MKNLTKLVSLVSLGDSYGTFLKKMPVSTLKPGSLKTLAMMVLRPRGLKPDLDRGVLSELIDGLSTVADQYHIKNLADLLEVPDASQLFLRWAARADAENQVGEEDLNDGVFAKLGVLSSLASMDFLPEDDLESRDGFKELLDMAGITGQMREFAWLVFMQAADKQQTLKEYLGDSRSRNYLVANVLTIMGDDEGNNVASQVCEGRFVPEEEPTTEPNRPLAFALQETTQGATKQESINHVIRNRRSGRSGRHHQSSRTGLF